MPRFRTLCALVATSALAIATSATAQTVSAKPGKPTDSVDPTSPTNQSDDADAQGNRDIVITGTVLRGTAPTGSNVISVSREDAKATGATTTSQLLATIPQISNMFNGLPQIAPGTGTQLQVIRPNLRNTPSGNTATGAATLILVDGHRMVGVGISQSAPDPDAVPIGAIERVEVVTDGGSSTYGADAIGGVINYITRRRFNGVQVGGRYGFADNYRSYDGNATVGKDWGTGSIYLSYSYAKHDDVFGRDRAYAKAIDWNTGIPVSRSCVLPTITTPGLFLPQFNFTLPGHQYAYPGLAVDTFNSCDPSRDQAIYPSELRHSVFAGFSQDLNSSTKVEIKAFYTHRESVAINGASTGSINISRSNPFYQPILSPPGESNKTQTVLFSYEPVFGNRSDQTTNRFDEWGITPTFTTNLNQNWQLRVMFNYGRSKSSYHSTSLNTALAQTYATSGLNGSFLDPYNITMTSPALLANIRNWENAGEAVDDIVNPRAILDGALFDLPGGKVRAAVGIESLSDDFSLRSGSFVRGGLNSLPYTSYSRNVKSVFGEIQIPLFGTDNAMPMFRALNIGLSARYDHYSDFGNTFNPKVGLTWKPIGWVTLRGNWGKSFNAPTPLDQLGSLNTTIGSQTFFYVVPPGSTAPTAGASAVVNLAGSAPNLKPQTAKEWSVGGEIAPPFLSGLRASLSYYYIDYRGALAKPPIFNAAQLFTNFPQFVVLGPKTGPLIPGANTGPVPISVLQAYAAQATNPSAIASLLQPGGLPVYELLDFRTYNLGNTKLSGLDFDVSYRRDTGFGSVDARVAGNVQLTHRTQVSALAPFTDDLANGISTLSLVAQLGTNIGNLRAMATLNHTGGYAVVRAANLPQDRVGAFNVVSLFFQYNVHGTGLLEDLAFTLNVNNVLNQNPPVYKLTGGGIGSQPGFANGATLGRFFLFGVEKKF